MTDVLFDHLLALDEVKFRRRVVPGDQLIYEVWMRSMKRRTASFEAKAFVGDQVAAEVQIRFILET